jgi:hypothetical protein
LTRLTHPGRPNVGGAWLSELQTIETVSTMNKQNKHMFERVSNLFDVFLVLSWLWFRTFEDIFGTQLRIRTAGQAPGAES